MLRYHKPETPTKKQMKINFNGIVLCLYGTGLLHFHSGPGVHTCINFQVFKSGTVLIKILSKINLSLNYNTYICAYINIYMETTIAFSTYVAI